MCSQESSSSSTVWCSKVRKILSLKAREVLIIDMQRQRHSSTLLLSDLTNVNDHQHPTYGKRPTLQLISSMEAESRSLSPMEKVERLVAENAVVVFSASSCCMCHVVKKLFCSMGVSPTVVELDEDSRGADMEKALLMKMGERPTVPLIFVGGKLVGGLDRLMAAHISGVLIPQLKEAGALWL